ncbi:hypothetical protein C3L33_03479, partial [Rhododendron williamsianum]
MEQQEAMGATEKRERERRNSYARDASRTILRRLTTLPPAAFILPSSFAVATTIRRVVSAEKKETESEIYRYYELKPEDPPYAAKFYDCCGAEDPNASGCSTSFHVSYDDE